MAACCAVAAYLVMRVLSMNKALGLESIFPSSNACKTDQDNALCTSRLNIKGITCAACVDTIQQSLEDITGVFSAPVSIITSQAVVTHDASVPLGDLVRKIEDLGYDAEESGGNTISDDDIEEADKARASSIEQWRKLLIGSAICTFVMEITARVPTSSRSYWSPMSQTLLQASTCSLVVLVFGHPIHREAITALRYWRLDMSLLASLGTLLAYLRALHIIASQPSKQHRQNLSLFESTALLMTAIVGGRFLKSTLMRQSLLSLNALRMYIPESATLVHGDQGSEKLETVSIAEVKKNDCLLIYPGGILPADGTIVRGVGFVAETHLNGEILPISKSAGSDVFAGSVNQDGLLYVKVARMGSSSWAQHILKLMLDANLRKSTTQELVDFVTGWFVGFILVIAGSTGAWYFLAGYTASTSIDRVIAILLCACPCALGLASPTAVMVGIGIASKASIFMKGGSPAIEAAAKVKTVLFDKTGTLTSGQLSVVETSISPEWRSTRVKESILWTSVLLAEENSTHPVACTMVKEARRHLQELFGEPYSSEKSILSLVEFTNVQGLGTECILQIQDALGEPDKSIRVIIGSRKFITLTDTAVTEDCFLENPLASEKLPENVLETLVTIDGVLSALVVMTDEIRSESRNMISQLKRCGYNVGVITGGTRESANSVANAIGIHCDWVWAGLLPPEKVKVVDELRWKHGKTAVVGDNLNDIQAMSAADFSIAAFVDASSITAASADALLIKDLSPSSIHGLMKIPYVLELAREVYNTIWKNLVWAMIYNILAVLLSMGVLESYGLSLSSVYAGFGMSLSSVLVLIHTMRLECWQPNTATFGDFPTHLGKKQEPLIDSYSAN